MYIGPDLFLIFPCYNPRELLSLWGLVFLYFIDINPHPGGLTASTLGGKCCG